MQVREISDLMLQQQMQQGDSLADPVTAALLRDHRSRWPKDGNLFQLIRELAASEGGVYQDFVAHVNTVPTWVDFAAMEQGQALFKRTSPFAIGVMVLGVLGRTYAPASSADVLVGTGRLQSDIVRRLYETADMVHRLLEPSALQPGALGHEAVIRVRLMHSLVRQRLGSSQYWRYPHIPINQVEMGLVGLEFIVCLIDGLERLGFAFSADDKQSYVDLWRYAHYLQGVSENFIPHHYAEATQFYARLRHAIWCPNENSKKLMDNLLAGLHWLPPFHMPRPALAAIAVHLMEPELSSALGLKRHPLYSPLIKVLSWLNRGFAGRYAFAPRLKAYEAKLGKNYFDRVVTRGLGGQPVSYLA